MTSLLQHTKAELRAAGLFDSDADYDGAVAANVVSLMETFVAYGHSGGSAALTIALFTKLVQHKPLTPLTGEDAEWADMSKENSGEPLWQNIRASNVFRDKTRAWIVHDKPNSTDVDYITFPYSIL